MRRRKESDRQAFEALAPGCSHVVVLDVTEAAIAPAVDRVERDVGPIDFFVNNAGYGHEGLVEESSMDELRRQFEVNVFGAVAVTRRCSLTCAGDGGDASSISRRWAA